YKQIIKYNNDGWQIVPQDYQKIWKKSNSKRSKGVKPDIVIKEGIKTLIIDTKWKLPEDDIPDDGDLKQMFMYKEYAEGANTELLYRKLNSDISYESGEFVKSERVPNITKGVRHLCGVMQTCVLDNENNLAIDLGTPV